MKNFILLNILISIFFSFDISKPKNTEIHTHNHIHSINLVHAHEHTHIEVTQTLYFKFLSIQNAIIISKTPFMEPMQYIPIPIFQNILKPPTV